MNIFDRTPGSPLDRALTLREHGDIEGAITFLYSAVSESLTDRGLVITLAKMLAETDQLERAEHWFRHAQKIAPGDLDFACAYGTFLAQTGRLAEAREELESARTRARALAEEPGEVGEASAPRGLVAAIELNLARVCLELRDFEAARALVLPWLTDEDGWGHAHDVFVDLATELGLDPTEADEEGLSSGLISPLMVCHRLEQLLEDTPPDLLGFERVVARADELFDFDWRHGAPELEEVLAKGRQAAAHAIMRGTLTPELVPNLLSLEDEARFDGLKLPDIDEDGEDEDDDDDDDEYDDDDDDDEDDDDDDDDDGDEDEDEDEDEEQILRLAGWNDTEPGLQIRLLRRADAFFLETTHSESPHPLDEQLAGWLVSLFARAISGFRPPVQPRAVPVDRDWLVEGLGCSQVIRFDRFSEAQWPLVHAAIALCQLESCLVAKFGEPNPPFTALAMGIDPSVATRIGLPADEGLIEVKACWTENGFVFARQPKAGAPLPEPATWFASATHELLALLPELELSLPCLVHPVAAWALLGHAHDVIAEQRGDFRGDWLEYCHRPVHESGLVMSRDFEELGLSSWLPGGDDDLEK